MNVVGLIFKGYGFRIQCSPFITLCLGSIGMDHVQGSKIALVRSYLRVPQAAGQVKIFIFLVQIIFFPIYVNTLCDAGQVPTLRYFET